MFGLAPLGVENGAAGHRATRRQGSWANRKRSPGAKGPWMKIAKGPEPLGLAFPYTPRTYSTISGTRSGW